LSSEFGIRNSELPPAFPQEPEEKRPCTVGLTGGLATGKSTVASLLTAIGIPVFDADAAVHHLYESGGSGAAVVAQLFGPEMLDAHGRVNRAILAERVLGDPAERGRLEAAIHPMVRRELQEWLKSFNDRPIVVVEAALLIETGSYREYDLLMVVWCEQHQQIQRARHRGVPTERLQGLMAAQLPIAEKMALADVLVDNRGDLEGLSAEIDRAWSEICRLCEERIA
jgi:dephospho-CoA kinase